MKLSLIKKFTGENDYGSYKKYSVIIVVAYIVIYLILWWLSHYFHHGIIACPLYYLSGFGLLSLLFIAALTCALDIPVTVKEEEDAWGYNNRVKKSKPFTYKLSVACNVATVIVGLVGAFYTGQYMNKYGFECSYVYVEEDRNIYHLDSDCEYIEGDYYRIEGYGLANEDVSLCKACKEYAEDMAAEAETLHARR